MVTRWEVTKAVRASGLPAPSRLIMLTLADVAEVGTAEIPARFTPSLRVLADETGLDKSTVTRHLNALDEAGWLDRTRPDERAQWEGERTRYRLTIPSGLEHLGVGAEKDTVGAQDNQGGRTEQPGVGAESDGGGRTPHHLETDHSDQAQISSDHPSTPPAPKERKRGTRIPADFAITDPMRSWAYAEAAEVLGRDPDRPKLDVWLGRWTAEFIDYWTARSGNGSAKVDWPATWRNRVRTKLEQTAQQIPQPGTALAVHNGHKPSTTDQRVNQALALAARYAAEETP